MRTELSIIALRLPRSNEFVVMKLWVPWSPGLKSVAMKLPMIANIHVIKTSRWHSYRRDRDNTGRYNHRSKCEQQVVQINHDESWRTNRREPETWVNQIYQRRIPQLTLALVASNFMGTETSGANFESLTWIVHAQEDGRVRIGRCPNGLKHIVLSDVRSK